MARGRSQGEFTDRTKKVLSKRVGERCSRPDCPNVTSGPHSDPTYFQNTGKAAHIIAASSEGPRGDPSLTLDQRKHPANGVWLCATCHDIVDRDPAKYPAPLLRQWKESAEQKQENRLLNQTPEVERQDFWLSEIEWAEDYIDEYKPKSCLEFLDRIQPRFWDTANAELRQKTLRLRARSWLQLNEFQKGADFFAQAAACVPESLLGKCDLAHSHYISERPTEAEKFAREALVLDPTKARAQALVIAAQAVKKTYEDILRALPKEWLSSSDVAYALGACALSQQHFDDAVAWFEKAKALNPEANLPLLEHYSHALFKKAESVSPMCPGRPLRKEDRDLLESAVSMLREAWEIVSDTEVAAVHLNSLSNAVVILFTLGDYKAGTVLVDQGLSVGPDEESLVKQKAMLLLESGQTQQGELFLRDAVSRKETPSALGLLAMCLLNKGETSEVQGLLDRLLVLELDDGERERSTALQLLYYLNSDKVEDAKAILNGLTGDERKKPVFRVYEARILLASGSKDAAAEILRSLASEATKWPPIQQLDLADTCHRAGLLDEAIAFFSQNVSLDQDSSTLRKLMECYVRIGDKKKAFDIAHNLRQRQGPLQLVTRYEASVYEEIGDLLNCAAVLKQYIQKFYEDYEARLWLADILLRLGNHEEADKLLAQDLNWKSLPADHICFLAQILTKRGRALDALNILYAARREQRIRRTSFRVHMGYIVTFMRLEEKEQFNASEVGPGTSVGFSGADEKQWRTILNPGEEPISQYEFPAVSPLAQKFQGKKVGDKVILKESPYSKEEVTITEVQSNYVRAFQEVFEFYEEWFGSNAGLWGLKLPKLEDGSSFDFSPIYESAIERESHVHEVLSLYNQGFLCQASLAQLLGGHFLSAWAYLVSTPNVGVRFTSSGPAQVAQESENLAKKDIRLVVDLPALLTIRLLGLEAKIRESFGQPLIVQATLDEIAMAISKEEMFGGKERLSVASDKGKIVGHEFPKEVAEHNITSLKEFETWVRQFCEVTPVPRILSDLKKKAEALGSAVGDTEAHTLVLAASEGCILYSDDLVIRSLARGELSLVSVSTESVLVRMRDSKQISDEEYLSKNLQLFELNYRESIVTPELIVESASRSQWTLKNPFDAVCMALRHGSYDRTTLLGVVAKSLLDIADSPASETLKVQLSCHLLSSISTESNGPKIAKMIIDVIHSRSPLFIPSDQRVIDLVKFWSSSRWSHTI